MSIISHPDKVLFPDDGITKGEVAAYYEAVAPIMVPHIRRRPITMERFPAGIGRKGFIQKDVVKGFPSWLKRVEVPKKGGTVHYALANDTRSLLWLANQNAITVHIWPSRLPSLDRPDLCVFDLDPSREDAVVLRKAMRDLRAVLDEFGLPSFVKTSGSKGFHVVVPMRRRRIAGGAAGLAERVARILLERDPEHLTREFSKADRGDRIYFDTARNHGGQTFAAPYTVRATSRCAGVGAMHVGGGRERRGRAADVHASHDGRANRSRRGSVAGSRLTEPPTFGGRSLRADDRRSRGRPLRARRVNRGAPCVPVSP